MESGRNGVVCLCTHHGNLPKNHSVTDFCSFVQSLSNLSVTECLVADDKEQSVLAYRLQASSESP